MPPNTVYVGRPTQWGNPFSDPNAAEMNVRAYRALLERDFKWFRKTGFCPWTAGIKLSWSMSDDDAVARLLAPLRGKNLSCWCPLDKPCHADVILELANK